MVICSTLFLLLVSFLFFLFFIFIFSFFSSSLLLSPLHPFLPPLYLLISPLFISPSFSPLSLFDNRIVILPEQQEAFLAYNLEEKERKKNKNNKEWHEAGETGPWIAKPIASSRGRGVSLLLFSSFSFCIF